MEKVNLDFFYLLGAVVNRVSKLNAYSATRLDVYTVLNDANPQIRSVLKSLPLQACVASGLSLIQVIEQWVNSVQLAQIATPLTQSEQQEVAQIAQAASNFELVLYNELGPLHTYFVEQTGGYAGNVLLNSMDEVLLKGRSRVSQRVRENIAEAGRCLAFENATAAGFHVLRATEGVMYQYYLAVFNPENKRTLDNWHRYLDKFKTSDDGDVKRVVALAELIKEEDRDRIMHLQRDLLNLDSAMRLFEDCKTLMMAMADRLPEAP